MTNFVAPNRNAMDTGWLYIAGASAVGGAVSGGLLTRFLDYLRGRDAAEQKERENRDKLHAAEREAIYKQLDSINRVCDELQRQHGAMSKELEIAGGEIKSLRRDRHDLLNELQSLRLENYLHKTEINDLYEKLGVPPKFKELTPTVHDIILAKRNSGELPEASTGDAQQT